MKGPSTKTRLSLGLTGLATSALLAAMFFGLVPDRDGAVREGRAALTEALAVNSSVLVSEADLRRLRADLRLVVERNANLLSAALRRDDGNTVVTVGPHASNWTLAPGEASNDAQVQVPIWAGSDRWGQLELRYQPLVAAGWLGYLQRPAVALTLFIAGTLFVAFFFYLGKALKHLDPSQAIPARVRAALDTMAEGLLVLDRKLQIVLANQAFAGLVGEAPDDLMGRHVGDFPWYSPQGRALGRNGGPWKKALQEGRLQKNVVMRLKDGEGGQRTFMTNSSPIMADGGKHSGALISFDDVTELEEKERELRKSKDQAEAANRAKSDFLATMSHEIRTPMNAILGFTEVLQRGYARNDGDRGHYLRTIHGSGQHLLELINDILDLSKIESDRLEIERTRCAAHEIIHEVVQVLSSRASEKSIALEFQADDGLPETILSDSSRLRQIVTNLTGNAIKFTDSGHVAITARLENNSSEPRLAIDVADTGVGMPADKLEAIFDPFVQADSSITRRFGGTGLGLSISRRLARALGGDVTARSKPGKGSVFTVTVATGELQGVRRLTRDEAMAAAASAAEESYTAWDFPAARVLVVDDGAENRELVSLVLHEVGLTVDTADNGQMALERVREASYDVILMDVQMPVMDGFTATARLRERGCTSPILALTANAMKGHEQECLTAGFSGYMTKPIDLEGLVQTLAELLGGRQRDSAAAPATTKTEATASTPAPNAGPVVSRLADKPRMQPLIVKFAQRLRERMDTIEQAAESRDFEQLATQAHWLKGAAGTVGFDVFTKPAAMLEKQAKANAASETAATVADLRRLVNAVEAPDAADTAPPLSATGA